MALRVGRAPRAAARRADFEIDARAIALVLELMDRSTGCVRTCIVNRLAATRFGSGKSVKRVEDDALLTGRGLFADDVALPRQAAIPALAAPACSASSIDVAAARAARRDRDRHRQDLVAGVKPLGSQGLRRAAADGGAAATRLRRRRATSASVREIVAETAHQARDAAGDRRALSDAVGRGRDAAVATGAPVVAR
jgi:hypothetical protein